MGPRALALLALLSAGGCATGLRGTTRPTLPAEAGWLQVPGVNLALQTSRSDCGAAALTSVLAYWRPGLTEAEVRHKVGPVRDPDGIGAARLREVARAEGFDAFVVAGSFADLVNEVGKQRPVIAGVVNVVGQTALPHYEVVVAVNPHQRRILTADPARGWREQSFGSFESRWKRSRGLLLIVLPRS